MTRRVTVLHPWLPQYRVAFFEAAIKSLASEDVELTVAHGAPPPDVGLRRDDVTASWAVALPTRTLQIGGRAMLSHRVRDVVAGRDLVIAEQAIRNTETYRMALRQAGNEPRLALWGHGRTYTKTQSGVESWLKNQLTLRAHWFFAYTQGGADYVASLGYPTDRITVVQNAVDTEQLQEQRARVGQNRIDALTQELALTPGRTALCVGALDPSKRLDLLMDVGRLVAARLAGFRLILAGAGPLVGGVRQQAANEPWLRYVGPAVGAAKAELAAASDLMLLTGRVGLVAVDSFALALPIATTNWALHAPEFEYLADGDNAAISTDSAAALAASVTALLGNPLVLNRLREGCREAAATYTQSEMVRRFGVAVTDALAAPTRCRVIARQTRPADTLVEVGQ